MAKKFIFNKVVYLTDTNLFGNTYFAQYFDWQGMAREEFFKTIAKNYTAVLKSGIIFITISASINFKKETTLFDDIKIIVQPSRLSMTTVELTFLFYNKKTKELVARGKQKVGFANAKGEIIPLPRELIGGAKKYLSNEQLHNLSKIEKNILSKIGVNR